MNIIRFVMLTMIVVLVFFGVSNLTALITYVNHYISIACLIVAAFLIFVVFKTWRDT